MRISTYFLERFLDSSSYDHRLHDLKAALVQGLDEEEGQRCIHNLILEDSLGNSHQIDHLVFRPNGVFCIETKNLTGHLSGKAEDKHWFALLPSGKKRLLLSPLKQNEGHVKLVEEILGKEHFVTPVVVLIQNNAASLGIPNVINIKDLGAFLESCVSARNYEPFEIEALYAMMMASRSNLSAKRAHEKAKAEQQRIEKALTCPLCGGKLVERLGVNGSFYECGNYPRCRYSTEKR